MQNILYLCEIKKGYRLVVSKTQECERLTYSNVIQEGTFGIRRRQPTFTIFLLKHIKLLSSMHLYVIHCSL